MQDKNLYLKYTPSPQLTLAGLRLQLNWLGLFAVSFVTFFFLMGLFAWSLRGPKPIDNWPLFLGVAAVFAVLGSVLMLLAQRYIFFPFRVRTIYRQSPMWLNDVEISVDLDGVECRQGLNVTHLVWSDIQGFKENASLFQVCINKLMGYPIPKAACSPEQVAALRKTFERHLKRL